MFNDIKFVFDEIGYILWFFDWDFILGVLKEENIFKVIDSCFYILFFVLENYLLDEWLVFIFWIVFEKFLRFKSNYLIVILSENVDINEFDEEIKNFVSIYVIL